MNDNKTVIQLCCSCNKIYVVRLTITGRIADMLYDRKKVSVDNVKFASKFEKNKPSDPQGAQALYQWFLCTPPLPSPLYLPLF